MRLVLNTLQIICKVADLHPSLPRPHDPNSLGYASQLFDKIPQRSSESKPSFLRYTTSLNTSPDCSIAKLRVLIMQRISSRLTRTSSLSTLLTQTVKRSSITHSLKNANLQKQQEPAIPGYFLKWGSLGFIRTSRFATGFTPLEPKPLDSIMDIERAKTKSPEDLASIWDDYHLGRGHIGASMKAKLYQLLVLRAADCKYFVVPLWRGSGYTTMFAQVQTPHIIFTGLEDYKSRGTQASPYLTVKYYTDFAESKDLVLIRGDIVFTSKLTDEEAEWLVETAQSFYLNDARYKLVEQFNKQTRDFEFKDVLRSLNMPIM